MAQWMEMHNEIFIKECLVLQLWPGAVVVMDNVPAHKISSIETLIQSTGANVLYLSPYSPDFNPPIALVVTISLLFCVSSPQPQLKWLIL